MKITSDVGSWSIVPEWVLDAEISDRAVRLYALLGRYADSGGESFASRRTIAERLRCSVNSVDRALAELVALKALKVEERRRANGSQSSNLYTLRMVSPLGRGVPTGGEGGSRTGGEGQNESQNEL